LAPYRGQTVKISNFSKTKMAAAVNLTITKIAISTQRFDRSLQNLAPLCKMVLLTVPTVKKFEFPKSKMAEAAILKKPLNRHISATVGPSLMKFGTVTQVCLLQERDC